MKRILMILLLIGAIFLTACTAGPKGPAQIANPASTFCVDNGGTLDIRTADDGSQTGYCTINGKECEEWALYRGECNINTTGTPESDSMTFCTTAQRGAVACTLDYNPVCGSDGVTYGNACGACAVADVKYWVGGKCATTKCGPCPQYVSPGPDFCKDGKIVAGVVDKCGCQSPPTCKSI